MNPEYPIHYFEALRSLGVDQASIEKAQVAVEDFFRTPPKNLESEPWVYFSQMVEACEEGALRSLELSTNGKNGKGSVNHGQS